MYDKELLADKLTQVSDALDRVARRFAGINSADDSLESEKGLESIFCWMIVGLNTA